MDDTIAKLIDAGALGMFAGFLIYLNGKLQKRIDGLSDSFQRTIEAQEKAHAAAEDIIRKRYDDLLRTFNDERGQVYTDVVAKIDAIKTTTDDIKRAIK